MATAAYQFAAGSVFGGKSDNTGNWGQTTAALQPKEPLWLAQAAASGIAGAANTRQAALQSAAQVASTGIGAAGSVLGQSTASLGNVAGAGIAGHAAVASTAIESASAERRLKQSQRMTGSNLLGTALMGAGALMEMRRKREPMPTRRTVAAPTFLEYGGSKPAKA